MRVLVTGGAGFIGSHIVEYFQKKAEVRVLDNLRSGYRTNLDSEYYCNIFSQEGRLQTAK